MTQPPDWGTPPPAGGYQPSVPAAPPPRAGRPWWFWLLSGCAGCATIFVIGGIVAALWVGSVVKQTQASIGTVTTATIQQGLGADAPLYPKGSVDLKATKMVLTIMRGAERVAGKKAGGLARGIAILETSDPADKVHSFYKTRLPKAGWKHSSSQNESRGRQEAYAKGSEVLIVQTGQARSGKTMVTLMRGLPEMAGHMPAAQSE